MDIKVGDQVRTPSGQTGRVLLAAGGDIMPLHVQIQLDNPGHRGLSRVWILTTLLKVEADGTDPT